MTKYLGDKEHPEPPVLEQLGELVVPVSLGDDVVVQDVPVVVLQALRAKAGPGHLVGIVVWSLEVRKKQNMIPASNDLFSLSTYLKQVPVLEVHLRALSLGPVHDHLDGAP